MNYEHKSSLHKNNFPLPIKIVVAIIVLITLLHFTFPRFLSNTFTNLFGFLWGADNGEKLNPLASFENSLVNELRKENNELKSLMNHHASPDKSIALAYIVKKPPFSAYDSYIIDIEKIKDVEVGTKVFSTEGLILGEIFEINSSFAKVKLYSTYGEIHNVFIGDKDIETEAIGQGGGFFEVILPKDSNVKIGDNVRLSDSNTLVFGIVKDIIIDPARSFSTILFSQPINIYEQKWVIMYI